MRVLIIEDDPTHLEVLRDTLASSPGVEVEVATSRNAALEALERQFDLVICDLKLPAEDGSLDASVEHGLNIVGHVREVSPGLPIIVLSAFGTVDLATDIIRSAPHADVSGSGNEIPLASYYTKSRIDECIEAAKDLARDLHGTDSIEIRSGLENVNLDSAETRALRIFSRSLNGRFVNIVALASGLSGSKVLRLSVVDQHGRTCAYAVAKIASLEEIRDEDNRYRTYVAPLLTGEYYAAKIDEVSAGAGDRGALFYRLAEDVESLFSRLRSDPDCPNSVIPKLRRGLCRWTEQAPVETMQLREIRREFVDDDLMAQLVSDNLANLNLDELEEIEISRKMARQHRDLHGENVLIGNSDSVVIIDYGDVGVGSACLDPITLELSLLFHPACIDFRGEWPTVDQARTWEDIDSYLEGCPTQSLVRQCREWSHDDTITVSDRDIYANAYAIAIKQFKYDDTDKRIAKAIVECCRRRLLV